MLAIVKYDYKFLFVGKFLFVYVGYQGRISDRGVFRNSAFNNALERSKLNLTDPAPLPTSTDPTLLHEQNDLLPYVFVANDAFPLGKNCMKPYPQTNLSHRKRLLNYRPSRIRRISENVFGIWSSRFCVFTTAVLLSLEKTVTINTCNGCISQHAANEGVTAVYWWKCVR